MYILGFDIGGVNIKASLINNEQVINNYIKYYPMWTNDLNQLSAVLENIKSVVLRDHKLEAIAITMTAELSDAFYTKREGILIITDALKEIFSDRLDDLYFINTYGNFIKIEEVIKDPLQIAAANWAATSKYVSRLYENCILIDIGSTTTDIIPIINSQPKCLGKTDPDRLLAGELIYTGVLRTEIPSITHKVPYKDKLCRIASEKFALSADVHLVLGNISEDDYICDTADGREKNKKDSLARLSRVICADIEMLSEDEILEIANYIYKKQIEQVQSGLEQVFENMNIKDKKSIPIVITGLGSEILARKAAENLGFTYIINLDEFLGEKAGVVAPSAAIAILLENELKGGY
ncbi:MAG: hydantoinase/oxoprolinase family protein [Candidatus Helarchaeota archaeon]